MGRGSGSASGASSDLDDLGHVGRRGLVFGDELVGERMAAPVKPQHQEPFLQLVDRADEEVPLDATTERGLAEIAASYECRFRMAVSRIEQVRLRMEADLGILEDAHAHRVRIVVHEISQPGEGFGLGEAEVVGREDS